MPRISWHLKVDRALGFGTDLCSATAPELFRLGAERHAAPRERELTDPADIALAPGGGRVLPPRGDRPPPGGTGLITY